MDEDSLEVMVLARGRENYIFMYREEYTADLLRILGRFACNPELSFTWRDAFVLSTYVREKQRW